MQSAGDVDTVDTVDAVDTDKTVGAAGPIDDDIVTEVVTRVDLPFDTLQTPPKSAVPKARDTVTVKVTTPDNKDDNAKTNDNDDDDLLNSRLLLASRNASQMEHQARQRAELEKAARELMSFSPKTPLHLGLPSKITGYSPGCRLPYPVKRLLSSPTGPATRKIWEDDADEDDNSNGDTDDSDKQGTASFLERLAKRVRVSPSPSTKAVTSVESVNANDHSDDHDVDAGTLLKTYTATTYGGSVHVKRKGAFLHVYRRTVIPPAV